MVAPTRQKNKSGKEKYDYKLTEYESALELKIVPADGSPPFMIDLNEFDIGDQSKGGHRHNSNFAGKPTLIREIAVVLNLHYSGRAKSTWIGMLVHLRALWRFEERLPRAFQFKSIHELTDMHGEILRRGLGRYYSLISAIIFLARENEKLMPLNWPASQRDGVKMIEDISEVKVRKIYHGLRSEIRSIKMMWRAGERLLNSSNWDLEAISKEHKNLIAYYNKYEGARPISIVEMRKYIPRNIMTPCYRMKNVKCQPLSMIMDDGSHLEYSIGPMSEVVRWRYPTKWEATCIFLMVMVMTGWNADTVMHIDLEQDWQQVHPLNDELVVLRARKNKTNTWQTAVCLKRPEFHPYQLIHTMISRTEPLRKLIQNELDEIADRTEKMAEIDIEIEERRTKLMFMLKSPWLYISQGDLRSIGCMTPWEPFRTLYDSFNEIAQRYSGNERDERIRKITPSDLRDAWIGFAYANSGYSWLVAKVAAGHQSIEALRHYLRQRRWRVHGEGQVNRVMDSLWSELRARRLVDGTVLRQLVQSGNITEDQRQRIVDHRIRTRTGVGCLDFMNPPAEIAPHHPVSTGCMVQRCILCRHALIFEDSLPGLALRAQEMKYIKGMIPMTAWLQSSFSDEEEMLDNALELFDRSLVQKEMQRAEQRISSGQHRVMIDEGHFR